MDLSKLDQNDRTAAIASAVLVIAGLFAATTYVTYGITWLAILAGVGMLFVVLQPQIASGVNLPGSKGSLMLILGGIAAVIMVLALLTTLGFIFVTSALPTSCTWSPSPPRWSWRGRAGRRSRRREATSSSGPPAAGSTATAPPEPSPTAAAPEAPPAAPPAPEPVTPAPPEPPARIRVEPAADRDPDA